MRTLVEILAEERIAFWERRQCWCASCGDRGVRDLDTSCSKCLPRAGEWTIPEFLLGTRVRTPKGSGVVAGLDLPQNPSVKRLVVKIDEATAIGDLPCFFLYEVEKEDM